MKLTLGEPAHSPSSNIDTNAAVANLTNTGVIDDGFFAQIASNATTFNNSGEISATAGAAYALSLNIAGHQTYDMAQGVNGVIDQTSLNVTNTGAISGAASISAQATSLVLNNGGTVSGATVADYYNYYYGPAVIPSLSVVNATSQTQTVSVTNSGSILSPFALNPALYISATSSSFSSTVSVVNTGVLRADAGAVLSPPGTSLAPETPLLQFNAGLAATASGATTSSVSISNAAGGVISSVGPLLDGSSYSFPPLSASTPGQGSTTVFAQAGSVNIANSGEIDGGAGLTLSSTTAVSIAGQSVTPPAPYLAGAIESISASATLLNTSTGVINGSIDLGTGVNTVTNYGAINGDIYLRGATSTFTEGLGAVFNGVAYFASGGTNALTFDVTGGGTLSQGLANQFVNVQSIALTGPGAATLNGSLNLGVATLTLGGGAGLIVPTGATLQTTGPVAVAGVGGDQVTNQGVIGGAVVLSGGVNQLTTSGAINGAISFASPEGSTNTLTLQTGAVLGGDVLGAAASSSTNRLVLQGAGSTNRNFANFTALDAQGSGLWVLGGTSTIGSTRVSGGTLAVTGALTSTFTINSGASLVGGVSNLIAHGTVTDNGLLALNQATDASFANPVVGSGGLLKMGAGVLSFSGASSVGATEVAGGTLIASAPLTSAFLIDSGATLRGDSTTLLAQGQVSDNGALVFDQGVNGAFANAIVGVGVLTKQNAGLLVLNGQSHVSSTTVTAGDLQIGDLSHPGAVLVSPVTVQSGATLSGHGTIIGDVTNNGGTVSPGGSVGVLTIQGNFTQTNAGVVSLQVAPQGASSLNVTGTANLSGTLVLVTQPGVYRKDQQLALVTAGTVVGDFTDATTSNGLPVSLSFKNGAPTATFLKSNFVVTGGTANQNAIGAAFADYPAGVSDFDPVASAVTGLSAGTKQNAALDVLGGEVYADFLTVGRDATRLTLDSVTVQLSAVGGGDLSGQSAGQHTVWGKAFGQFGTVDPQGGAHGFNHSLGGAVAGVQYELGGGGALGAAVSYSHSDFSLRGLAQSGVFDAGQIAVDAEQRWGGLFVDGAASIAYEHGVGDRHINLPGVSRKASGGFDGYVTGLWGAAGWRVKTASGVVLEPSANLVISRNRLGGLTETGAGGADLAVGTQGQGAAQASIGVRFSKTFMLKQGALSLDGRVAQSRELGAVQPMVNESFAAAPGTSFTLAGVNPGRNATVISAGATMVQSRRLALFSRFETRFSPRQNDNSVSLGARLSW